MRTSRSAAAAAAIQLSDRSAIALRVGVLLLALAAVAHGQSVKAPVEIPFEFVHNQIVVQVKIGGKGPYNMLLDTNTDPSAIDAATARELGLTTGSNAVQASGGGTEVNTVYPATLPSLEIGGISVKQVAATAIDLSKISQRIERPIHGVLGFSFLKDRIVQIDYEHSKLRFFAESPYPRIQLAPNTVNTIAMTFRREDGEVIVDSIFINNEKMRATLDTGSSGTFTLTPEAAALLGLDDETADGEPASPAGDNGEHKQKQGILKSVRMGRFAAESVQADFWLPNTGHDKKKFDVNIGNGFFQDFMMTFDFKNKIVVFERVD